MPFIKKIQTEIGILGIWELTESADFLQSTFRFSETEFEEFEKIKAERRKIEYLAIRLLLQQLLNEKAEINYHNSGKPYFKNKALNISISHSAELVTVIISEEETGIDVENTQRKIDRIANRFLHEKEAEHIQTKEDKQIAKIFYWSAKEAIFKCTDFVGVQFNKQILINPCHIKSEGNFTGTLTSKKVKEYYKLWYLFYKNNVIVYCVKE